jgi:4a-hydroxytetrahydrobiopterin dehydratase
MTALADQKCTPVDESSPRLDVEELQAQLPAIGQGWSINTDNQLQRDYSFPDFLAALAFVNAIAEVAEEQNHHPDLFLAWGKVRVTLWTHVLNAPSQSDCIMAAKIERLHQNLNRQGS